MTNIKCMNPKCKNPSGYMIRARITDEPIEDHNTVISVTCFGCVRPVIESLREVHDVYNEEVFQIVSVAHVVEALENMGAKFELMEF